MYAHKTWYVKSIGQIDFKDKPFLVSRLAQMNKFFNEEDRISNLSIGQETSLVFRDERREKGFKARSKDFGQDLVRRVEEGDGPKSSKWGRSIFF